MDCIHCRWFIAGHDNKPLTSAKTLDVRNNNNHFPSHDINHFLQLPHLCGSEKAVEEDSSAKLFSPRSSGGF